MEETRLNKYLSMMGVCSRREADHLIETGQVQVDGQTAVMGMKVREGQQVVCRGKMVGAAEQKTPGSGGRRKPARPRPVLLMVNKPRGIVCTTSQKDRAMNIVELVQYPERIYPAGRLDKDSEGLILMTNQGELANQVMRAGNGHEKEYVVTVDRPVTAAFIRQMEAGVWLEELGVTTRPCRARATGVREFQIILTQGLNRQIRRMCQALGYHVQSLRRVRIMNLRLGGLKTGTYRNVTEEEYRELIRLLQESEEGEESR